MLLVDPQSPKTLQTSGRYGKAWHEGRAAKVFPLLEAVQPYVEGAHGRLMQCHDLSVVGICFRSPPFQPICWDLLMQFVSGLDRGVSLSCLCLRMAFVKRMGMMCERFEQSGFIEAFWPQQVAEEFGDLEPWPKQETDAVFTRASRCRGRDRIFLMIFI